MHRLFLIPVLAALCGCGVNVSKPTAAKAPEPPEPEIYDKVAPMPREVKNKSEN